MTYEVSALKPIAALLVANLAHGRVVDPHVDRIGGPEDLLSVVCGYAQSVGAAQIRGPRFDAARGLLAANASALLVAVRREVARIE
jgi:hypothetical protein